MTLTPRSVVVDSLDPRALATWWARQVGGQVPEGQDDAFVVVTLPDGGIRLAFQKVAEPTPGKNRLHLDLSAPDREAEVERLLGEGALVVARHEEPTFAWVVLADPEGNQFCVFTRH